MAEVPITDPRFKAVYRALAQFVSPGTDALVDYTRHKASQAVLAALREADASHREELWKLCRELAVCLRYSAPSNVYAKRSADVLAKFAALEEGNPDELAELTWEKTMAGQPGYRLIELTCNYCGERSDIVPENEHPIPGWDYEEEDDGITHHYCPKCRPPEEASPSPTGGESGDD